MNIVPLPNPEFAQLNRHYVLPDPQTQRTVGALYLKPLLERAEQDATTLAPAPADDAAAALEAGQDGAAAPAGRRAAGCDVRSSAAERAGTSEVRACGFITPPLPLRW
jgi:hypothetical protein